MPCPDPLRLGGGQLRQQRASSDSVGEIDHSAGFAQARQYRHVVADDKLLELLLCLIESVPRREPDTKLVLDKVVRVGACVAGQLGEHQRRYDEISFWKRRTLTELGHRVIDLPQAAESLLGAVAFLYRSFHPLHHRPGERGDVGDANLDLILKLGRQAADGFSHALLVEVDENDLLKLLGQAFERDLTATSRPEHDGP